MTENATESDGVAMVGEPADQRTSAPGPAPENDYTCSCEPDGPNGCEAARRGTPELCSAVERQSEIDRPCGDPSYPTEHERGSLPDHCVGCRVSLLNAVFSIGPHQMFPSTSPGTPVGGA